MIHAYIRVVLISSIMYYMFKEDIDIVDVLMQGIHDVFQQNRGACKKCRQC